MSRCSGPARRFLNRPPTCTRSLRTPARMSPHGSWRIRLRPRDAADAASARRPGIMSTGGTTLERWAVRYARVAIGAAFLSAVAGRFGLWTGHVRWESFARFIQRTAELNGWAPAALVPVLAWTATILETTFGVALVLGIATRWVALGSAVLLAWFATAMALYTGCQSAARLFRVLRVRRGAAARTRQRSAASTSGDIEPGLGRAGIVQRPDPGTPLW